MTVPEILTSLINCQIEILNNRLTVVATVTKVTDDSVWVKEGEEPYPIHFLNIRFVHGGEKPFIGIV